MVRVIVIIPVDVLSAEVAQGAVNGIMVLMRLLNCIIHSQVIVQPRSVISQVDYVCNAVVQGVVKLSVPLMQRGGVDFLKVVLLFLFLLSLVVTDF